MPNPANQVVPAWRRKIDNCVVEKRWAGIKQESIIIEGNISNAMAAVLERPRKGLCGGCSHCITYAAFNIE